MKKITYITPDVQLIEVDSEGVLCSSGQDVTKDFLLPDYDPSDGEW